MLIGDGSHGTYEFYAHRANITQRLIQEKGFTAVAVEVDWPDAFCANRFALMSPTHSQYHICWQNSPDVFTEEARKRLPSRSMAALHFEISNGDVDSLLDFRHVLTFALYIAFQNGRGRTKSCHPY